MPDMHKRMRNYLFLLVICFQLLKPDSLYADDKTEFLLKLLEVSGSEHTLKVSKVDPLYPSAVIIRVLWDSMKEKPGVIIGRLEELLHNNRYFSSNMKEVVDFKKDHFIVGTVKSFRLWREALYMILGRAYYENGEVKKAIFYYRGIPVDSYFARLARLELGWALLKNKKVSEALKVIREFEEELLNGALLEIKNEFNLLKSYHLVVMEKYDEAIELAESFKITHDFEQLNLQKKVLAESRFGYYLDRFDSLKFDQRVEYLKKIVTYAEGVSKDFVDSGFSFLAGEALWHLASVYRVEEPVKYRKIWQKCLVRADNWMKPWVDKSIREKKAYITEEAMFFSIAVLWEMEKYKEADRRLVKFPRIFPRGEYLEDVYQMLGDYHYDEKRFKTAVHYYDMLTEHGSDEKTAYGVYKAAWSFYNLDKKWTTLRHLERLFLYYTKKGSGPERKKGLYREVREDLLTVMVELLDWKKSLKETAIFDLTTDEDIKFKASIAASYRKIGKYKSAISVWNNLLLKFSSNKNSLEWLANMSEAHLASGNKGEIAGALNMFLPKILESHAKNEDGVDKLDKNLVKIILTVHKEARKSENQEDWLATDSLYTSYEKFFPESKNARLWYYGAQRMEKLKKYWSAIRWYKKVAVIPEYVNYLDAAHSVLRIVSDVNERMSLDVALREKNSEKYKKIVDITKWYLAKFPKNKKGSALAEFIHVEALYFSGNLSESHNYIVKRFNHDQDIMISWNIYTEHNKRLYRDKRWKEINHLSDEIFKSDDLKKEWISGVSKIYQESAFQTAYEKDKTRNDSENEIIKWYYKSAYRKSEYFFDKNIALKSWHNIMYRLFKKKKVDHFKKEYHKFMKIAELQSAEVHDDRNLLFNIHNLASKVHDLTREHLFKANDLVLAYDFTSDSEERSGMLWNALLLYGSYNEKNLFASSLKRLKAENAPVLNGKHGQLVLARLYYYFEEYEKSWELMTSHCMADMDTQTAILFVDLYTVTSTEDKKLHQKMHEHMMEKKQTWQKLPYLTHLWAFDGYESFMKKVALWRDDDERMPASKEKGFKESALEVKFELGKLSKLKTGIKNSMNPNMPQLFVNALCVAPVVTQKTIENLRKVKGKKIEVAQWGKFEKRLDEKIGELTKIRDSEEKVCREQSELFLYYPQKLNAGKFCSKSLCFDEEPDSEDIVKLERKWSEKGNETLESMVLGYLKIGAVARAEYVISNIKDSRLASFLTGLIRLANNDTVNASRVFKELAKDKNYKEHSQLYLSYMADYMRKKQR